MDKVYALRKGIEFEQPRFKYGIRSSQQIGAGQRFAFSFMESGVFGSTVIDNQARFIVVSYPIGNRLPRRLGLEGQEGVYLFLAARGRRLRLRQLRDRRPSHPQRSRAPGVPFRGPAAYAKRKSVRARSKIPAYLYLLKRIEGAYEKPERAPGLRALVQDLSDDGAAVAIGGKARPGLQVKLQFGLDEGSVVMSGTVKSVDFDAEANRSILHIEAVPPSPRMRNAIRSFVYNIREDSDTVPQGG